MVPHRIGGRFRIGRLSHCVARVQCEHLNNTSAFRLSRRSGAAGRFFEVFQHHERRLQYTLPPSQMCGR